jgi:hypothetical protein
MDKNLEQIITTLREGQQMHTAAWNEVLRCARQYVQMKLHCSYIENGRCIRIHPTDQKDTLDMFTRDLLQACERAFLEDALLGASLQQQLTK